MVYTTTRCSWIFFLIFATGFLLQGHAELQCYYCEDCDNPLNMDDVKLDCCPILNGPTSNFVSTTSEEPSTTTLKNTSPKSTITTTVEVKSSTTPITTTLENTSPTTTVSTTSENTSSTSTDSTTMEVTPPTTTDKTTDEGSTTGDISITYVPDFPITLVQPSAERSTIASNEPFNEENNMKDSETQTMPSTPNSQETTSKPPSSTKEPKFAENIFKDQSELYKRSNNYDERTLKLSIRKNDPIYYCYSIQSKVNSTFKTQRGCIKVEPNEDACDNLRNNFGEVQNCRVCTEDKCNGSRNLIISTTLVFISLIISVLE